MDHESLRHFADSWGLAALVTIFVGIVIYVLRPKGGRTYREAAQIPLKDDPPETAAGRGPPGGAPGERLHSAAPELDKVTGRMTTGHSWDGIQELNTPLPRWWLWTFYASILFAIVYMILYPAIPLFSKATDGVLGHTERGALQQELAAAKSAQAGQLERIAAASLQEIPADPDLLRFAVAGGRSAFAVNCSQCHGSGGQGATGFPNLNDDEWLWGGSLDAIEATITHGIRYEQDPDTRQNAMPAFGRDGLLTRGQISDVTAYVMSLSDRVAAHGDAAVGKALFQDNCAACHGAGGDGNRELGAPSLRNAIWLYGSGEAEIFATIHAARNGVMPAWGGRLDPVTIKQLSLFVHSLGGGE
ncbi:MAG: cytochrome-c oxidase, cbb3-type subunit III [Sneathiellaceae bacterium]